MKTWVRVAIISLTVFGGLYGLVEVGYELLSPTTEADAAPFLMTCLAVAYAWVITAGVLFWRNPLETRPVFWALALQVPWISLPGFVYKFASGFNGVVALFARHQNDTYRFEIGTKWSLGPLFEFRFLQNAPIQVGVNAFALILLLALQRWKQSVSKVAHEQSSPMEATQTSTLL